MPDSFPHSGWLDFAEHERAPGYYALLGLECFEADTQRIEQAFRKQAGEISAHLKGQQRKLAKAALAELHQAEACLKDAAAKAAYDAKLRASAREGGPRLEHHQEPAARAELSPAAEPAATKGRRSTLVFRRLPTGNPEDQPPPSTAELTVDVGNRDPAAESPTRSKGAEDEAVLLVEVDCKAAVLPIVPANDPLPRTNVRPVLLVEAAGDRLAIPIAPVHDPLPNEADQPVLLIAAEDSGIPIANLPPDDSMSEDDGEGVLLLEVLELPLVDATSNSSADAAPGTKQAATLADGPATNESAAAIAGRILRDDVKPKHVPRRASEEAERKKLAAETEKKKRQIVEPEDKKPAGEPDKKRSSGNPRTAPPPARIEAPPAIAPRLKRMPTTPLLSPADLAETMRQQAARQEPQARGWTLPVVDVSLLLDRLATRLVKHRQRVAAGVLVLLGAWFALGYADQVLRPPRARHSYEEASTEDRRRVARQLRVLHDERESPEARAAAVEELRAAAPAAIREFAAALESVVDKQAEPTIQQDLRAILQGALETN